MAQMTTYVAISWMARAFYFNNLDREIADEIRTAVSRFNFIRPYSYLIGEDDAGLGRRVFPAALFMCRE